MVKVWSPATRLEPRSASVHSASSPRATLRLIPFLFEERHHGQDNFDQNGDPWFIAADVCRPIGIKNHRDASGKAR